ncbi:hypothetical protein RND71_036092 [Anisodus tanguticus]|uniref:Nudix hydrolase domain-containing protein n=1 Tax=Anisodus tanguticus TaxID=243964 RepID=A0AAE1R635_9SOLA|nr:hypothetical protein RND71_036092 [Anisodus tanguticus]
MSDETLFGLLSGVVVGGWENDETVKEAAVREAIEEAGVRGNLVTRLFSFLALIIAPSSGTVHSLPWSDNMKSRRMGPKANPGFEVYEFLQRPQVIYNNNWVDS